MSIRRHTPPPLGVYTPKPPLPFKVTSESPAPLLPAPGRPPAAPKPPHPPTPVFFGLAQANQAKNRRKAVSLIGGFSGGSPLRPGVPPPLRGPAAAFPGGGAGRLSSPRGKAPAGRCPAPRRGHARPLPPPLSPASGVAGSPPGAGTFVRCFAAPPPPRCDCASGGFGTGAGLLPPCALRPGLVAALSVRSGRCYALPRSLASPGKAAKTQPLTPQPQTLRVAPACLLARAPSSRCAALSLKRQPRLSVRAAPR